MNLLQQLINMVHSPQQSQHQQAAPQLMQVGPHGTAVPSNQGNLPPSQQQDTWMSNDPAAMYPPQQNSHITMAQPTPQALQVAPNAGISGNGTLQGWANSGMYTQSPYGTPQPDVSVMQHNSPYHMPLAHGTVMPLQSPLRQGNQLQMIAQRSSLINPQVGQSSPYNPQDGAQQGWVNGGQYIQ